MNEDVCSLFHELADLSPEDRTRIFQERRIDSAVRAEVESLLGFDSASNPYLTDCISAVAEQALGLAAERNMESCGQYRLVRLLGSGGMGAVYLGERTDGEIQQRVAIKFLGAGNYRDVWRDRFLQERQLLASLNHPSIVKVLDAGHTQDGRPYLVMEYVEGISIDVYAASMAVREQLELFLGVCAGVSHAHRHLIIHRDLKPSNILVDGAGQPKLLDFGIAKLLDESGDQTQTVERLLTPHYASPEQLRGDSQTTATDVYSLGAVLYKLLTGRSPHESITGKPESIATLLGTRVIPPASSLHPGLPADLDYILRKALRLEPDERYASVDAFANDIRALLDSRPVQARSGNAWYRTRKFLRRYWMPATAATLVVASLSVGLYVANRERAIAQQRFMDVRQLANKLFDIDVQAREVPGNSRTRQLIVDTSLEYLRRLSADIRHDPELALDVANAYMRVARVQGVPVSSNLGQLKEAEKNLRIAEEYIRPLLQSQPSNRTAILRSAQIAHDRMLLARFNGREREALAFGQESAKWLEKFTVRTDDRPEVEAVLATYMNVAQQHRMGGQLEEALRLSQRGDEIAQSIQSRPYLGMFRWVSAGILQRRGDPEEAMAAIREAVSLLEPGIGNAPQGRVMNYVLVLTAEGRILGGENAISLGRPEEAVETLRRAFGIADKFAHQDAKDQASRGRVAETGLALASILRHSDAKGALAVYDHVLHHLAEIQNNVSFLRYEVTALARSADPLTRLGRSSEAQRRLDRAFECLKQLNQYPTAKVELRSEAEDALRALAAFEAQTGRISEAAARCNQLLAQFRVQEADPSTSLEDAIHLSNLYQETAALHRRNAEPELASGLDAERRMLWQRWGRKLPNSAFVHRQLVAAGVP